MYVKTRSGSIYALDDSAMIWERIEKTGDSGLLRTETGQLLSFPQVKLGQRALILGPPINEQSVARTIVTTPIVEIHMYPTETEVSLAWLLTAAMEQRLASQQRKPG
jgi:hypothetical protein